MMISVYLSKQQAPDTDPKAILKSNFTGNLYFSLFLIIYVFHYSRSKRKYFSNWNGIRQFG